MIDLRHELMSPFDRLRGTLLALHHNLEKQTQLPTELEPVRERVTASLEHLDEIFNGDDPDNVYWFQRRGRGLFLHQTPIRVAPILRRHLFERTDTTILTSATLTTNQNFEYLKERLGIPDPAEVILGGEFNYASQAVLYVPRFLPEPRSTEYFLPALRLIRCLLDITRGHTFLLFTSIRQMEKVYSALLQKCPYPLLRQGEMPRNRLLERFRNTPGAVLCATSSFWQGVDVQGDALRAVIIDKLPFAVPTEPIVAARMHHLRLEGENPFLKYTLPSAVITLKQGLGRLIRSRRDRGLLAILDSRLWTKRYGEFFWSSLPKCPVTDNMEQLRDFYSKDVS
jgi:ATP-dependent DNA helicase DinG